MWKLPFDYVLNNYFCHTFYTKDQETIVKSTVGQFVPYLRGTQSNAVLGTKEGLYQFLGSTLKVKNEPAKKGENSYNLTSVSDE